MPGDSNEPHPPSEGRVIVPIPFDPLRDRHRPPRRWGRLLLRLAVAAILLLLGSAAWFTFTATPVRIDVQPAGAEIALPSTLLSVRIDDRFLLRPVEHALRIEREGYATLDTSIRVEKGPNQSFAFVLTKLPGRLRIRSSPVDGARVIVDATEAGLTPLLSPDLEPGPHSLEVVAARYLPYSGQIEVEGEGKEQVVDVELTPAWANITLSTSPPGATVSVDGKELGTTPGSFEILAGTRKLEAVLAGYNPWSRELVVEPNRHQALPEIELREADGELTVTTDPPGAQVRIGTDARGVTPLTLAVPSKAPLKITVVKSGYQSATRAVQLAPGQQDRLEIQLKPRLGIIEVTTTPAGAQLEVDGSPSGPGTQRLSLVAVPHRLIVRKDGYADHEVVVTPEPGRPQRLNIRLQTNEEYRASRRKPAIVSKRGQRLVLVSPGRFLMGSSRRERGRRPNEVLRGIELTRPYYLGVREISNAEFRAFLPSHRSNTSSRRDLDGDTQPATSVTWEQAARFCNWLSAQESMPPAYVERGGKLGLARPLPPSYRLPTEAEWIWAARFAGGKADLRYAWGDQPNPDAGNYADQSASGILENTLPSYSDGFPVSAPVGKGKPNPLGLLHLGGNVAEWVNDLYTIYPSTPLSTFARDPLGPANGRHRVVRGASWRVGNINDLRLAYRDYEESVRDDLGFRIARYAD